MAMDTSSSRKERLKRMRDEATAVEAETAAAVEEPKLKFRNYVPRNEKLEHQEAAQPKVQSFQPEPVEPQEYQPDYSEELLINVAPKKPNWDLRRDMNKKLERLERRTQRAMIQIMQQQERQLLEDSGGVQD